MRVSAMGEADTLACAADVVNCGLALAAAPHQSCAV